ncbi:MULTISPECIES: PP2C family protein-serine/threonine phosphatase [unclassified Roseovarius]|uniref:Transcriptional regulatory protein AfsQ1 n=1 Tax=Roseovarius mucosus TaxID=215743 RepID=A0A1V0RP42_9RHOB|nr:MULTISPECIES: SpoIIE family protein phosphatase [unclassified Roseovarius]ARE83559.1 transcriptional regulatory protein AfsQ1 [Roseovarius mucosus]
MTGTDAGGGVIQRVLVVDDSRLQRRILTASLQRWGFEVQEAESGEEALRLCRDQPPDLVMSDWMMPGLSGLEFCRKFRDLQQESYGYFILLTSKSDKDEVALGLDAGADDFLTKPVNAAELRARISAGARILRMQRELTEKNRLIKSTLDELQTLYDSLDSDLVEAKKLQQSLVSERYRDFGAAEVSLMLQSAGHVGGDLVGMFPIGATRIGLYGIDVSGHGISSALMTARLAGYLSASVPEQNLALRKTRDGRFVARPPAQAIAMLNRLIMSEMETEHYFTLVLADVDLESGRVILSQAGHPHPALQRADGTVEFVGAGGLPVGLIDGAEFEQFEVQMGPGDRLLIHSDGVIECAGQTGALLQEEGLAHILRDLRQTRGMALLESLIWKLSDFAGDADFDDDISGVLLEFKGSAFPG